MSRSSFRWTLVLLLFAATIVAAHFVFEPVVAAHFERLAGADWNGLTVSALIVSGLIVDILLPVPSSVIAVWAGVSLGAAGGFAAIWLGLCAGCLFGYWLGAGSNTWLADRFMRQSDFEKARRLSERYGTGALVLLRAVPVLAETSVVAAGLAGMPLRRFLVVTGSANAGLALVYAGIGGYANEHSSFLVALAGSIAVPAAGWGVIRLLGHLRPTEAPVAEHVDDIEPAFQVGFDYPVRFTRDVFATDNRLLADCIGAHERTQAINVLFVVDGGVMDADPGLTDRIDAYCRAHNLRGDEIMVLPGGEAAKTQDQVDRMHRRMLERQLDRQSYVIAVGGGALLDAAGYAAATFHRGIRIVRMPTTVLAQDDAGIGVKNGINAHGIKNLMGCFTVPHAVINDSRFLETLSGRVFRSGFAEAIKVALIRDAAFFDWIEGNAELLNRRDETATRYLIKRCAELHIRQIAQGGDPFETGSARPLDYGHWSAHKLESLSGHRLSHGEAVAIGMALDALYAVKAGYLTRGECERLLVLLERLGFDLWHPALQSETADGADALMVGLEEFRQHLGGKLCITLLKTIGRGVEVNSVDTAIMASARDRLRDRAGCEYQHGTPGGAYEAGSPA